MPTTGDWVALSPGGADDLAQIEGVLPRTGQIARLDAQGRAEQVLAANVDLAFVVHGLDRPLKPGRLERSMVMAWESGATPVLVLTKADLIDDAEQIRDRVADEAPRTSVHLVSGGTGEGLDRLRAELDGNRTAVLLGESGAGKSTIVNQLVGEEVQATGDVRSGDRKGRHTTTTRDLLLVPSGGVVIDTPGLRALGLWDADEGLALVFADIEEVAAHCRFADCAHDREPGCAVKAAVAAGELDDARVARYLLMHDEVAQGDARRQAAAQRERKRQDKVMGRAMRRYKRDQR
jgi:ribosome biogenesis GTPase / thiamine phosphate phosphatase